MARSGLNLAWADRPLALNGARSIGRALFGLAVELPVGLVEAESALGALVSADLATLTDVEPSAGLARALADGTAAPAPEQAEPARATRITRPVANGQVGLPPPSGTSSTSETRRHLKAVSSSGLPLLPTAHSRPLDAPNSPPWRHLSTAAAIVGVSPVGAPDLVRMASPSHRKAVPAEAVVTPRRAPGEPAPTESTPEISNLEKHWARTPVGAEHGRRGVRPQNLPTTVEDRPRERSTMREATAAPKGQGLAALVEAWNHTNGDGVPGASREGDTAAVVPRSCTARGSDTVRDLVAVDAATSFLTDQPPSAAAHWDPVSPSDLDTEAVLLDVLARALRTEARRFGIEPDVGLHR